MGFLARNSGTVSPSCGGAFSWRRIHCQARVQVFSAEQITVKLSALPNNTDYSLQWNHGELPTLLWSKKYTKTVLNCEHIFLPFVEPPVPLRNTQFLHSVNSWVLHPVARVSLKFTKVQVPLYATSVFVFTTCFGPVYRPSSGVIYKHNTRGDPKVTGIDLLRMRAF
jgi:hypothetical protein